jgi:hypothetical protein
LDTIEQAAGRSIGCQTAALSRWTATDYAWTTITALTTSPHRVFPALERGVDLVQHRRDAIGQVRIRTAGDDPVAEGGWMLDG